MNLLVLSGASNRNGKGRTPTGGGGGGSTTIISSVTGTVANGNSLTIAGTKLWDQVTTGWDSHWSASKAGFEGANPAADGYTPQDTNQTYDSTVKLMGSKSMKCVASGASDVNNKGGSYFDYITDLSLGTGANDCYYRTYVRWNANAWPTIAHKFWWLGGVPKSAFVNMQPNGGAAPSQLAIAATDYNGGLLTAFNIPTGQIQNDLWYCVELHVRKNGAGSYVLEVWWDNQVVCSVSPTSGVDANPGGWGHETNTNWWDTSAGFNWTQWQDGFVVSSARVGPASLVEIGNNADYVSATKVYQRPTSIADGSVVVTCDLTGLGAGPYWMWVTNSQGVRSDAFAL